MELTRKGASPAIVVIFGATGDLTTRKLLPALYNLAYDGELPSQFACVGFARREKDQKQFRDEMKEGLDKFSRHKPVDPDLWSHFSEKLYYHQSEFDDDKGYESLKAFLKELDVMYGTHGNRIFYLSVQPKYFPLIVEKLKKHGLLYDAVEEKKHFSRIIIEKPFGHNLKTALALQNELSAYVDEPEIYRIDHYLGKETVQNILTFRFLNPVFEHLWSNQAIESMEITVAEEMGIGTRGNLWEEQGLLRDIVQNHMMQLLTLALMEAPPHFTADNIKNEKVKVLKAVRKFNGAEVDQYAVRGQYDGGIISEKEVMGYRQENNVSPTSKVETFAALKLFVDNERWKGVPIYLRSGKRLTRRCSEIAVTFKPSFPTNNAPNVLVIHVQPNEGISLNFQSKVPSLQETQTVRMDFRYDSTFGVTPKEAYERLILDCLSGDSTLFLRDDEVLASWEIMTPILEWWEKNEPSNFPNYLSGSNGPDEVENLLEAGHQWRRI
jgi:glucose-6-phosphate 1-dehydrogenase